MRSGSYPRQQTPLPEPSRSMWRALFIILPIAPALILLPAIAFASPPDPSWIAGIYDGADGDDIVSLVYETSAAKTAAPSHVGPLPCLMEISLEGLVRSAPGKRFTPGPRGPPARCSPEFASVFNSLPPPAQARNLLSRSRRARRSGSSHMAISRRLAFDIGAQSWLAPANTE